jgi:hypothetical protein
MKEHIDFMMKIAENPYYPVPIEEYPKLFDFNITPEGLIYFERLKNELSSRNELSENESLYLCLLHLAYATSVKSVEECHNWQEFIFKIGKNVDLDKPRIKETLKQMGCIVDDLNYNPKLYKSHLLWKNKMLATIDNM